MSNNLSKIRNRKHSWWITGVVLIASVIYVLTIRPDQDWTEDFALYIQHAKNWVSGLPYAHFGTPFPGGESVFRYPPGFPVLLMPIVFYFGVDLYAMKVLEVAFFCALLLLIAFSFRRSIGESGTFALIVLLAANPTLWSYKDHITSDFPFLFFCFATLEFLNRKDEILGRNPALYVVPAILLIYFTYSIRAAAVVLPLALLGYELLKSRRISLSTLTIGCAFFALVILQSQLFSIGSSYGNSATKLTNALEKGSESGALLSAFVSYFGNQIDKWRWVFVRFFDYGDLFGLGSIYFYGPVLMLAIYGYMRRLIRCPSIYEVFVPGYLAIFVVTNFGGYQRYMFPVLVMLLFYMIYGIRYLPAVTTVFKRGILTIVTAVGVILYAHAFATTDLNTLEPGVESPDALALFRFIREETEKDAVLLTQNPQATSLFTDRFASRYNKTRIVVKVQKRFYHDHAKGWEHYDRVKATHVVVKRTDWPTTWYFSDRDFLDNFICMQPDRFVEIYRNDSFLLFRIVRDTDRAGIPLNENLHLVPN